MTVEESSDFSDGGGSVSHWLQHLSTDVPELQRDAQRAIWQRYFTRLSMLARNRMPLGLRVATDEQDAALSALQSFFERAGKGAFPDLYDRSGLWPLLARITAYKVTKYLRRERADKRGGGTVQREAETPPRSDGNTPTLDEIVGAEPTPEFASCMNDQLQHLYDILPDKRLRAIARWKLEGYNNQEIADQLQVGLRTVERKLARIRTLWEWHAERT